MTRGFEPRSNASRAILAAGRLLENEQCLGLISGWPDRQSTEQWAFNPGYSRADFPGYKPATEQRQSREPAAAQCSAASSARPKQPATGRMLYSGAQPAR